MDVIWNGVRLFVAGPDTGPVEDPHGGPFAVGVRFRPGVGPLFLGVPAATLRDARVGLGELWPTACHVEDELAQQGSAVAAAGVLEAALRSRLGGCLRPDPVVEHAARRFLLAEGRLLERRIAEVVFDGADAAAALAALRSYRNADGGFGQALEPDNRASVSQPLCLETALKVMEALGTVDRATVLGACDYLRALGPGVGCLTADGLRAPRAAHWGTWATEPSLNPTAGIVARLWRWDVAHPWREEATAFCWTALERGLPSEAHSFGEVLDFLEAVGDRDRAEAWAPRLGPAVASLSPFHLEPGSDQYGLNPLHFAPGPTSRWRQLFVPGVLDRHLDALVAAQQDDGGWPISWETVGLAARREWRGVETVRALRTLAAYGRLE